MFTCRIRVMSCQDIDIRLYRSTLIRPIIKQVKSINSNLLFVLDSWVVLKIVNPKCCMLGSSCSRQGYKTI
jgi:hypothetical protein